MSYLDVIGPGPWLQEDLMEPATFAFFSGLLIFCLATVVITILTLLVVMWIRSGNDQKKPDAEFVIENCKTEEPK